MKRLIAALLIALLLVTSTFAGPYDRQLRTDPPQSGRIIAEDGTVTNLADSIRSMPWNISRGLMPGATLLQAFGERTTIGAEADSPVWPDGAIALAPYNAGVTVQSTSASDAAGGTGIRSIHVHYIRHDYTATTTTVTLNGLTPVPVGDPSLRFIQCMHVATVGSGLKAAGTISATNAGATVTYSQIATGKVRCSSSFRMVPRDQVLYIDGAVGSSVSVTADTTTLLQVVANRIEDHDYTDPFILIPHASIGVQNNAISAQFTTGMGPFPAGTVVGCSHTSNKAATVSCSWFGRLEPAQ
jgi:hypothetical protein